MIVCIVCENTNQNCRNWLSFIKELSHRLSFFDIYGSFIVIVNNRISLCQLDDKDYVYMIILFKTCIAKCRVNRDVTFTFS